MIGSPAQASFKDLCFETRSNIVKMFIASDGGHLPSALSLVEILVTLFYFEMKKPLVDLQDPQRDRFILSKGHGCLAFYAILGQLGKVDKSEWSLIGKNGGMLGGHPTSGKIPGVEITTGSLGLAPSVGVGMAIYAKKFEQPYRTFVVLGDGECNEGSVWEAAMAASHGKLDNLCFIIDSNGQQAHGKTADVCDLEPFAEKWRAFGFETHDFDLRENPRSLLDFFEKRGIELPNQNLPKPLALICRTDKGMGIELIKNDPSWHNKTKLSDAEKSELLLSLGRGAP